MKNRSDLTKEMGVIRVKKVGSECYVFFYACGFGERYFADSRTSAVIGLIKQVISKKLGVHKSPGSMN